MTPARPASLALSLVAATALAGCATWKPPEIAYDNDPVPATLVPEPPRPVQVVEVPRPLPLPGQLQRVEARRATPEAPEPTARVNEANASARVQPVRAGFLNAVQVYPFSAGALYQVYTAPGQVTSIMLQEGESLVGTGPVAAGDTVRWIIGDTESGTGANRRVHIIVKPTRPDLMTNMIINTDRRTYHLELRSTERTYMASVSWQYPQDALIALRRRTPRPKPPHRWRRASTSRACASAMRSKATARPGDPCAPSTMDGRCSSSSRAASDRANCRRSSSSDRRARANSSTIASGRTT